MEMAEQRTRKSNENSEPRFMHPLVTTSNQWWNLVQMSKWGNEEDEEPLEAEIPSVRNESEESNEQREAKT